MVVGRPAEIAASATLSAVTTWAPLRQGIVDAVSGLSSPEASAKALAEWRDANSRDRNVARSIYEPAVQSDLAGQIFVASIEVGEATRLLADDPRSAFLRMTFEEAIAFWRERGGSQEALDLVLQAYRRQAARATALAMDTLSRRAQAEIERSFIEGGGVAQFIDAMNSETDSLGISPASPAYLETVFRTNTATAYGAGRVRQLNSPAVIAARPYRQYRASGDSRTRLNHRILDKLVLSAQQPLWLSIAPPNGFNCRCAVVSLSQRNFDQMGLTLSDSLPPGGGPDAGWSGSPVASI